MCKECKRRDRVSAWALPDLAAPCPPCHLWGPSVCTSAIWGQGLHLSLAILASVRKMTDTEVILNPSVSASLHEKPRRRQLEGWSHSCIRSHLCCCWLLLFGAPGPQASTLCPGIQYRRPILPGPIHAYTSYQKHTLSSHISSSPGDEDQGSYRISLNNLEQS